MIKGRMKDLEIRYTFYRIPGDSLQPLKNTFWACMGHRVEQGTLQVPTITIKASIEDTKKLIF